jgi:hypothetical protein
LARRLEKTMTDEITESCYQHRIEIQGHLSERRARAFHGLEVRLTPDGHTILSGQELDQSALFGILLRIRDLGVPLLSVTRTDLRQNEGQR